MIIILLLLALLAVWIWTLFNRPSKRARAIFEASGAAPGDVSDRDRAFVLDLHRRFGTHDFRLKSIQERALDGDIARRFGVKATRLDDCDELGVRLPQLKLLVSFEPGRYRLTEDAARLATSLADNKMSLETRHHG